jgi:DNA-binding beta-propeller fold protein YncE
VIDSKKVTAFILLILAMGALVACQAASSPESGDATATVSPLEPVWTTAGEPEPFNAPSGLALDAQDRIYVVDSLNHQLKIFDGEGAFVTAWGAQGSAPGQFNFIWEDPAHNLPLGGVAVDGEGNVYVADGGNVRIQKFDSEGRFLLQWGSSGADEGQFGRPEDVAVDGDGNVFVIDDRSSVFAIHKFDSSGQFLQRWGTFGTDPGEFVDPGYIAVDSAGFVYAVDYASHRVQKFDNDGQFLAEWGGGAESDLFTGPLGVAVDALGNIYVVDADDPQVVKLDPQGTVLARWRGSGSGQDAFRYPLDIAVDGQGNVYLSDYDGNRLHKFSQTGP